MARKAFHYMEVTFPQSVRDEHAGVAPMGIMRELLNEYIAETDAKDGKVLKEFVFGAVEAFEWKDNTGAYALEFLNERNRKTYFQARENFKNWLSAKGVETSYQLSHDIPVESVGFKTDPDLDNSVYYNIAKEFIMYDIPTQRGFTHEA
jgi:hypothetical protein